MRYPLPTKALDDRLAWTGTSGTGKTYDSGTAIERVLNAGSRVCIPDPLGVWWGLRLRADGVTASKFKVVIFGGPHGDLGLIETSGKLIGETVAGMAESCILDLSEFDTEAAQRRFMLAFIVALYGALKDQLLHVVFDEADMWAPQQIRDKEGDATKLHHHMQKLVRRGRVKGFIPWLITQRPAELSKSVLSQVDGIVAHQLVAPQDVGALMDWVGARADKPTAEMIRTQMPAFGRGEAVVYIPRRGVLEIGRFPEKVTFDSSRAPERGKRTNRPDVQLKPLDIAGLQKRLEKVEAEAKANDPVRLKARIAELERELRAKPAVQPADPKAMEAAEAEGFARGTEDGNRRIRQLGKGIERFLTSLAALERIEGDIVRSANATSAKLADFRQQTVALLTNPIPAEQGKAAEEAIPDSPPGYGRLIPLAETAAAPTTARRAEVANGPSMLPPARQKILDAIAWAGTALRAEAPGRDVIAFLAGVSSKSSGFANNLGALRTAGLIDYPGAGTVALTAAGEALAAKPDIALTHEAVVASVYAQLPPPLTRILKTVVRQYPDAVERGAIADMVEVSATSSGFANNLGRLSSLGLVTYPKPGHVRAADFLFPGPEAVP